VSELQNEIDFLSPEQVAKTLGVHPTAARRIFTNYPGVLNIGRGKNKILRIPKAVLQRFLLESDVSRRAFRRSAA
jgi:hypothetical protein